MIEEINPIFFKRVKNYKNSMDDFLGMQVRKVRVYNYCKNLAEFLELDQDCELILEKL